MSRDIEGNIISKTALYKSRANWHRCPDDTGLVIVVLSWVVKNIELAVYSMESSEFIHWIRGVKL